MITLGIQKDDFGYYCLDEIKLYDRDTMKNLRVKGWRLSTREEEDDFYAYVNGKAVRTRIQRMLRPDVIEKYGKKDVFRTEIPGFEAEILLGLEELLPDARITFGIMENRVLFSGTYQELQQYRVKADAGFFWFIDRFEEKEDQRILDGWAYLKKSPTGRHAASYEEVDFQILNQNQKAADPAGKGGLLNRKSRLDLFPVRTETERQLRLGFHLEVPMDTETLIFLSKDRKLQTEISLEELSLEAREKKRAFKSFSDMLVHRDDRLLKDDWKTLRQKGIRAWREMIEARILRAKPSGYQKIHLDHLLDAAEIKRQKEYHFSYMPRISIIVPIYRTPEKFLKEMIRSVQEQTYANWQLCLADGSEDPEHPVIPDILQAFSRKDPRIVWTTLEKNLGISGNTNEALKLAEGEFISLLDHDDLLTPDALFEVVKVLQDRTVELVYSDEDKVSMDLSLYFSPHFKPDYSPDLIRSCNYISHFFTVKREIALDVGGFHSRYDGSQDYDFTLRCLEKTKGIYHIPRILYHWRSHPASTATNPESKMYCYDAGRLAIEDHLKRCNEPADVFLSDYLGYYDVHYQIPESPLVSIIIPTMDHVRILRRNIESILSHTAYTKYEILLVENNSREPETFQWYEKAEKDKRIRILKWEKPFNYAAINNFAARQAKGDLLLFLNNDMEVQKEDWLEQLVGDCERTSVGAAGGRLLYPDGRIQSAGIRVDKKNIAVNLFEGVSSADPGYFRRAMTRQNLSAVTGACLMVKRDLFESVGGFEEALAVDYNDVDLCLKIREAGYLIVFDPKAELLHYESLSRREHDTPEKRERFATEKAYMEKRWGALLEKGDPYYNPNLSLMSNCYALKE